MRRDLGEIRDLARVRPRSSAGGRPAGGRKPEEHVITRHRALGLGAAAALAAGMMTAAGPAYAEYGNMATYQVELSANVSGAHGGGVWLWLELSSDHTVDYQGADCGHANGPAAHDSGSTTWSLSDGRLVIPDVVLNGLGGFPATVTAPAQDGHYTGTIGSFISLPPFIPPGAGSSQLQVAP
jgi:hypothetical protein